MGSSEKEPTTLMAVRMPDSLLAELRLVAKENDRTLSAEARLALRAWLSRTEKAA
jgi:plasmid stability protein